MFRKIIGLVCLFTLLLTACGQSGSTPTDTPTPQPETFSVTGMALDTKGKPIPNAKIWIEPAVHTCLNQAWKC